MDTIKPVIIAICGASASGKDTLLNEFINTHYGFNKTISDTTRPPRINEKNHIDYNFISEEEFLDNVQQGKYLEYTSFNNWFYGKNIDQFCSRLNIGIFNPQGIFTLINNYKKDYNIYVIYIKCPLWKRFIRSIKREHKLSTEMIRRIFADMRDFENFDLKLDLFWHNQYIVVKNSKTIEDLHNLAQYIVHANSI